MVEAISSRSGKLVRRTAPNLLAIWFLNSLNAHHFEHPLPSFLNAFKLLSDPFAALFNSLFGLDEGSAEFLFFGH
jgi:hypothetical protein